VESKLFVGGVRDNWGRYKWWILSAADQWLFCYINFSDSCTGLWLMSRMHIHTFSVKSEFPALTVKGLYMVHVYTDLS